MEKDERWLEDEIQKIKKEKRLTCSSISSIAYTKNDNQRIKKIKGELKRKRRSVKRSEKQSWKKKVRVLLD